MSGQGFHVHGPHDHETRKKWLEYAMFGVGALGVIVGALAVLHF